MSWLSSLAVAQLVRDIGMNVRVRELKSFPCSKKKKNCLSCLFFNLLTGLESLFGKSIGFLLRVRRAWIFSFFFSMVWTLATLELLTMNKNFMSAAHPTFHLGFFFVLFLLKLFGGKMLLDFWVLQ